MNAPDEAKSIVIDLLDAGRLACLQRFRPEDIQTLGRDDLLAAQILLGHGHEWGLWQSPKEIAPGVLAKHIRAISLTNRLHYFLSAQGVTGVPNELIEEGLVGLTRLAVLMRLVPTNVHRNSKSRAVKPTTIAFYFYQFVPKLVARAIRRKIEKMKSVVAGKGLICFLTDDDMREFNDISDIRTNLERLDVLVTRGLWNDAPSQAENSKTTDPSKAPTVSLPKKTKVPHPPLPDAWLAEIGPRVLWVVEELGSHLLHLLEALPEYMTRIDLPQKTSHKKALRPYIEKHLADYPWLDISGRPLTPPFALTTGHGKHGSDRLEWPPRTYEQVVRLSRTLQAAHLFITLLATAGRSGEVATLKRDCVVIERDGNNYLKGFTFKLSASLLGDERQWPAPPILQICLGQQARLSDAYARLPRTLKDSQLPESARLADGLWVQLRETEFGNFNVNGVLKLFAESLGMNPKPGGKWVHAHRFRKTIGRLAGIALFNSPLVLKRLFGHKSVEMTLHYILSDPGIREEAETVLRELRIMHCAEALEEIHHAMANGLPLPGNGGAGAARLVESVENHEAHLFESGRVWSDGSAYDLACLLTGQGKGWRLINANIVCSKDWVCSKPHPKKELVVAKPKCDVDCTNRVVLFRRRRDTEQSIEQYLDIARRAHDEGMLLVMAGAMDNLGEELGYFQDLREKYLAMPDVQMMFALCEDSGDSLDEELG